MPKAESNPPAGRLRSPGGSPRPVAKSQPCTTAAQARLHRHRARAAAGRRVFLIEAGAEATLAYLVERLGFLTWAETHDPQKVNAALSRAWAAILADDTR